MTGTRRPPNYMLGQFLSFRLIELYIYSLKGVTGMGMETAGFIIGGSARGTSRIGYRSVACSDTPPWLSCAVEEGQDSVGYAGLVGSRLQTTVISQRYVSLVFLNFNNLHRALARRRPVCFFFSCVRGS
jgi:hypothetical protein